MASRRVQRLNEQLKREISTVLRTQVQDPRVLGVTVTGVEVSPDLTFARVWVRLPGEEPARDNALEGLAAAAPYVRRQLGGELRLRRVPELDFRQDRTLEQATRIERILEEVRPPEESGAEGEEDGDSPDPTEDPDA